jgi:S-adenosyl-L-methionine hydrolase (adenosine-forming)
MPRRSRKPPPLVTLTTDFGWEDAYVAEMKAVLLRDLPDVRLVDVSHSIPPQDVLAGSVTLERAVRVFAPGTVHLAVVDPGVGSERRLLVVAISGQTVVCPDNGLITWTWRRHRGARAFELSWRPRDASDTFHGRDVMAPFAARIAGGARWQKYCGAIGDPQLLDVAPADSVGEAEVIHVDHFGNATTNVPVELIKGSRCSRIEVRGHPVPLRRTYADVSIGEPLALIGSSELLEIAVRNGSAARELGLRIGDRVRFV